MTQSWTGRIFSGTFVEGGGGTSAVVAPATGEEIERVGVADLGDLERAVAAANDAQAAWAALPYTERSAVMTRAAVLLGDDPERLTRWLVPESGSGQGKAAFETGLVVSELHEAAALASAPYGQLLRSYKPRLSIGRHVPVGVVGVISPFNFPAKIGRAHV